MCDRSLFCLVLRLYDHQKPANAPSRPALGRRWIGIWGSSGVLLRSERTTILPSCTAAVTLLLLRVLFVIIRLFYFSLCVCVRASSLWCGSRLLKFYFVAHAFFAEGRKINFGLALVPTLSIHHDSPAIWWTQHLIIATGGSSYLPRSQVRIDFYCLCSAGARGTTNVLGHHNLFEPITRVRFLRLDGAGVYTTIIEIHNSVWRSLSFPVDTNN